MTTETQEKPLSFRGDKALKKVFVDRMEAHGKADEIIQGVGWENGKGCFIGCALHKYRHADFPTETGLPGWLGHLGEGIFESLKNGDAKKFAVDFYPAVPVGVDLEPVKRKFLSWCLIDEKWGVINLTKDEGIKASVKIIGTLLKTESERPLTKAEVAEGDSAARAARDAWAAWDARAAWAAWVARDARAAWDARAARAARDAYVKASAEKLLDLLRQAKK